MATRFEVDSFLNDFKAAASLGRLSVVPREKNIQALIDLGLTPNQRRDIIMGLEASNYYRGPSPDDAEPDKEVWEFGCNVEGKEIYIKLRLAPSRGKGTSSWLRCCPSTRPSS